MIIKLSKPLHNLNWQISKTGNLIYAEFSTIENQVQKHYAFIIEPGYAGWLLRLEHDAAGANCRRYDLLSYDSLEEAKHAAENLLPATTIQNY